MGHFSTYESNNPNFLTKVGLFFGRFSFSGFLVLKSPPRADFLQSTPPHTTPPHTTPHSTSAAPSTTLIIDTMPLSLSFSLSVSLPTSLSLSRSLALSLSRFLSRALSLSLSLSLSRSHSLSSLYHITAHKPLEALGVSPPP